MSTLIRFQYKEQGGHTHVRMFTGKGTLSLGLAGTLILRNEEWADFKGEQEMFKRMALGSNIEFMSEIDE